MIAVAPLAWGAGEHVELPACVTTFSGVVFGAPALLIGGLVLIETLKRTRTEFSVYTFQILAGFSLLLVAAVIELVLATRIGDSSTYDSLRDEDGAVNTSTSGFLFVTIFPTFILAFLVAGVAYVYWQAIVPNPAKRFRRDPDEPDHFGRLLRQGGRDRWS